MRAREIIQENYQESLESDLGNLLIGAKGSGAQEVNTQHLVTQLHSMGYAVDVNSIMPLLSRNPVVLNATPQSIKLTPPEGSTPAGSSGSAEDSASQVSDMAAKATNIK